MVGEEFIVKPKAIENHLYRIEIDPGNGMIVQIFDKVGGFALIGEPRLADSYRLLVPVPDCHANYLLGIEQGLTSMDVMPDGVKLHWDGPFRNNHGTFDLAVTMWVEFAGEAIQFRLKVWNKSPYQVAEVWYPPLSGFLGLGSEERRKQTRLLVPYGYAQEDFQPFMHFGTSSGLGTSGPERTFTYPGEMPMPWTCFYHPDLKRALYFAAYDVAPRVKTLRIAMYPGAARGRVGGDWPRPEELDGLAAGIAVNWSCFPYINEGETFEGPSVILQCHAGDWHQAAALYRAWFTEHFPLVDSRSHWIRQETAYLDTMFMLPEDNINFCFMEIPRWAKSAKDHGVNAVLISGWHRGGHDRGYPCYEPDPRLGTWDDLTAGIRACHDMGVRVFFFVNIQPVDMTTDWYHGELHEYVQKDPWGVPYATYGWGMGTLGARIGSTRTPLTAASPAFPAFREIITRQIRRLAEVGADGVHIDKATPSSALDFNPGLAMAPDRANWEGHLMCMEEISTACRAVNPEFCISYEGSWDRYLSYSDVIWWAPDIPSIIKETFPQWAPCVGIEQPYDYNLVNLAVLHGYNLLIGPAHYTASMDYPPMRRLSRYIGEITRIRRELHNIVSRGEPLASSQLHVEGDFAADKNARWSIFRAPESGKRAGVLVNLGGIPLTASDVAFEDDAGYTATVRQPFMQAAVSRFPLALTIPPERIAIIVEDGGGWRGESRSVG